MKKITAILTDPAQAPLLLAAMARLRAPLHPIQADLLISPPDREPAAVATASTRTAPAPVQPGRPYSPAGTGGTEPDGFQAILQWAEQSGNELILPDGQRPEARLLEASRYSDLLVVDRQLLPGLSWFSTPGGAQAPAPQAPLYIPGAAQAQAALLFCSDPACITQYLHLLLPVHRPRSLTLLSAGLPCTAGGEMDQKRLLRYIQAYYAHPSFYHTHQLDGRDLQIVLKPNTLVVLPLHAWPGLRQRLQPYLRSAEPAHTSLSWLFTTP
ncbi:MAG: hypothetical protein ACK51A_09155 [Sphingobacteriia bacterium]